MYDAFMITEAMGRLVANEAELKQLWACDVIELRAKVNYLEEQNDALRAQLMPTKPLERKE
jgi:outer membrane murein-binding lipoprotein Lpp